MPDLAILAAPGYLALLVLEALLVRQLGKGAYEARDTAASLTMGVGNVLVTVAMKGATLGAFLFAYRYRLFEIGTGPWAWALLFVAEDLVYYAWHRASHEVRFLWAAHENHHSSQHFNLSTALRQSWTTPFTTLPFWILLPLAGFAPWMVLVMSSVSLIYQFWIHTELIDRMGAFEWIFNTPSHHRVHHGANVEYLDRNHGGILIVWDRLFGTFEPERAPVRYGLTKNIHTFDPVRIAFHEWAAMLRSALRARSVREAASYLLQPPGWSPDGSTRTARELRRELARTGGASALS
ncbi:MAG TPA: C-5 sterol desaturase [Deltaproteobacteria bacterium]|jgi:sterol desaturase/sphingolipid hydroxylase (fatty acid hydroxylase superfamily)|nr:C-5 sterol desaturase [Deltaproteobacteria bacterium]